MMVGKLVNVTLDASVLINFLRINRMGLLTSLSNHFIVTDHVAGEISVHFPEQRQRFNDTINQGGITKTSVCGAEEFNLFASLTETGRLGAGECSAIALAVNRKFALAMDDRKATDQAIHIDPTLRIFTTRDLIVSMINEGLIDISEADRIKDELAAKHRFKLKLSSFSDICK